MNLFFEESGEFKAGQIIGQAGEAAGEGHGQRILSE